MPNIFKQAKQLLDTKPVEEMNYEEVLTVKTAMIPLNILPEFNDINIDEGLEKLAKLLDEANRQQVSGVKGDGR